LIKSPDYGTTFRVVKVSVVDPDPGSGAFLTPVGPGRAKKSRSGSGMNIPGRISESSEKIFGVKNT